MTEVEQFERQELRSALREAVRCMHTMARLLRQEGYPETAREIVTQAAALGRPLEIPLLVSGDIK